jgi:hypothetical protein
MEHHLNCLLCSLTECIRLYWSITIHTIYMVVSVVHTQLHRYNYFYLPLRTI